MFYFSFFCPNLWNGSCLLTGFNFPIEILLAKRTFLFWILLCYLLNMLSFCIGCIYWCCFIFLCSTGVSCSVIPWYSDCYTSVSSLFGRCSAFRCSWLYNMPSFSQAFFNFCRHKSKFLAMFLWKACQPVHISVMIS